ncbi:hypothetical protein SAMN04487905_106247 [Actinopolyspora xinjiangensis]|uniref:Uncharacterized protein n=1 Tax=Actinopolyspora xinjiangensis TaxID=405564 RepID=A0A1H0UFB2_9ACTN|nr:hypothetical protein [Actinopolyspora xinjiangensis]SDP64688.1 hypothetical protein SAMN04487905_106247 [Actinopolyspora xinjiangensis]
MTGIASPQSPPQEFRDESVPWGALRRRLARSSPYHRASSLGQGRTERAPHRPKRHGGGLVAIDVYSRAGRRTIGLPDQLAEMLRCHHERQEAERQHADSG